jgi:MFS family permease
LLPAYLLALGFGTWEVGLLSTATLLGSALATVAVGTWGHHVHHRRLLLAAALLMVATGLSFAGLAAFWPLLAAAFVGTLNPGSGDVSVFLPLEHARLAEAAQGNARTTLFARYSLTASLCAALGALATAMPDGLAHFGIDHLAALRIMFVVYGAAGIVLWILYRRLPMPSVQAPRVRPAPLGPSRGIVVRLAALFSIDAFAGGLVVQSLLALWLFQRFDLSLSAAGAFFFWAGLLTATSQLVAPWVASRIGLLNTMVFTHIPSSICLILAAFAPNLAIVLGLLLVRSALSQMDVPTRTSYVMAVVTPAERTAAASVTAVPRSLASSISPALSGALLTTAFAGLPLVICGVLKIVYDLSLLYSFRHIKPPEEKTSRRAGTQAQVD